VIAGREILVFTNPTGSFAMVHDLQLARGDICVDPSGFRVRVEDVDIYDYFHFSVIRREEIRRKHDAESGQMSHGGIRPSLH